ncbi:MAG TPA: formylglycine-generating enzyme family protein [Lysobacter sp.]
MQILPSAVLVLGLAVGANAATATFQDCADCTPMAVIPSGTFTIGSPDTEPGRGKDEGPMRKVSVESFALGTVEVTKAQYAAFVRATGRPTTGGCITDRRHHGDWQPDAETTWKDPGFTQAENHPVLCVSWDEAQAYIDWLNTRTTGGYRLPSEAEWEYVARAGSVTAYPWGAEAGDGCADANGGDATMTDAYPGFVLSPCRDGALNTAPVGSYRVNAFGVHDMIGNTSEWIEDCATMSYDALPLDGKPQMTGDCSKHLVRGGSWGTYPKDYRSANRMRYAHDARDDSIGIRVAKSLRDGRGAQPGNHSP